MSLLRGSETVAVGVFLATTRQLNATAVQRRRAPDGVVGEEADGGGLLLAIARSSGGSENKME